MTSGTEALGATAATDAVTTRIASSPARAMRTAIALTGGNEVCFACTLNDDGVIIAAKPVARGDVSSQLPESLRHFCDCRTQRVTGLDGRTLSRRQHISY